VFLFSILHDNFCQFFDSFVVEIGAAGISALLKTTKMPKNMEQIWKNDAITGEKKQVFGTGAKFSPH